MFIDYFFLLAIIKWIVVNRRGEDSRARFTFRVAYEAHNPLITVSLLKRISRNIWGLPAWWASTEDQEGDSPDAKLAEADKNLFSIDFRELQSHRQQMPNSKWVINNMGLIIDLGLNLHCTLKELACVNWGEIFNMHSKHSSVHM